MKRQQRRHKITLWNIWILLTARHLGRNLTGEEIIYWYFNRWYWLSLVKLFQKSPGVNMWFAGSPNFAISIAMLIFVLHHFHNLRRKFQTTFLIEGCHSNDCMGYDQNFADFVQKSCVFFISNGRKQTSHCT